MNNQNIFIILIGIFWLTIYLTYKCENFLSDNLNDIETNVNSYFKPIQNIFLADNYYNYIKNRPIIQKTTQSLDTITLDSFLYSKPTTQKIICSSHSNRANCWEDNINNCQWIHKIDGSSYCDVAPVWLL